MAGIKEIAERAGVSIATVSNVLHKKQNVSEETREKILSIAKELDYHPPGEKGKEGKGQRSRTIVFNFSDFDTLFYLDILHGISDYAYARGYDLVICSDQNFEHYTDVSSVCGCIVMDYKSDDAVLKRLADHGIPVIALDRELNYRRIKSIVVNNYAAEKQLVEGLIANGYQRFAFLGGMDTQDNRERYRAFRDALKEHGLSFHRTDYYEGDWREKSGAAAARLLMLSEEMPEVLVSANDMMAIGAIRKFQENGLHVPEDIAVCGYDDLIISKYLGLTTVAVPDYERGFLAAQALIDIMEDKGDYETFRIGARVKWRKSTKHFQ